MKTTSALWHSTVYIMNINKQDTSLSTLFNTLSQYWFYREKREEYHCYLSLRKSFRDHSANFRLSITDKTRSNLTTLLLMIPKVSGWDQGGRDGGLKRIEKFGWEEKNKVLRNFLSRLSHSRKHSRNILQIDETRLLTDEMFVQVKYLVKLAKLVDRMKSKMRQQDKETN